MNIENKEKSMLISIVMIAICSSFNVTFNDTHFWLVKLLLQKIGVPTEFYRKIIKIKEENFHREFIASLEKGLCDLWKSSDSRMVTIFEFDELPK